MSDDRAMGDERAMSDERGGPAGGPADAARSRSRIERDGELLANAPVVVALVAEAAWIAVFAGLLEAFVLRAPVTGIPELFLAATAGTAAARRLPPRFGEAWPAVAVALSAVAGVLGWLASAEVLALLRSGGVGALGDALGANPGGWLAALAFVRGIAHARLPVDPSRVGTVLAASVPGLALAAVLGGMISEPARSAFLATAQLQVLVFVAAAVLALALARLGNVGRGTRVDWRRNPPWLVLAGTLVVLTAGAAAWVALNAGHAIATAIAVVTVPLLIVGFIVGFDRRSLRIVFISLAVVGVLGTILRIVAPNGPPATPGPIPLPPSAPESPADPGTTAGLWILALVLAVGVGAVLVLARLWLRRTRAARTPDDEVRVIDRGSVIGGPPRPRWGSRFRRRGRPADAVAAYRHLLEDLDGRRPVAREPGETPAEHARRLRGEGHGTLGLELLAADYGLVRFGGVPLSDAETRRAIGRADRLRAALLRVPVEAPQDDDAVAGVRVASRPGHGPPGQRGSGRGAGPGADLPDADEPGETGSILNRIRRGP